MIIGGRFRLSSHAEKMRHLSAIRYKWLEQVLMNPDNVCERRGQKLYRRRVNRGRVVVEAVVDDLRFPNVVVTVYLVP